MPAKDKKRIKPVIEEVVEVPPTPIEVPPVEDKVEVQEVKPEVTEPVEEVETDTPTEPEKPTKKESSKMNLKLVIVITLVSALVAAFVSGGVYVYLSGLEDLGTEPENEIVLEPNPSPIVTPSPTPEPQGQVEISEYSVQVLNGSGAIGAAGGGEDVLTEAGFTIENTGNASNYSFQNTVVQMKADIPEAVSRQIQDALESSDYEVEVGDTLPDSSNYDIVVTIGRN